MPIFSRSDKVHFPANLDLPVRLLKQVLTRHGLHFGARVLIAGCGSPQLVAFLDGLGYAVDMVDDRIEVLAEAKSRFPGFEFRLANLECSIPFPHVEFDLVIVLETDVYRRNLFSLPVRNATVNLLTCLKPNSDLVFIRERTGSRDFGESHRIGCWEKHLACFPGQFSTNDFRESFFQSRSSDWLLGTRAHHEYFTVTLQIPAERISSTEWQKFATAAMLTDKRCCCQTQAVQRAIDRHAA